MIMIINARSLLKQQSNLAIKGRGGRVLPVPKILRSRAKQPTMVVRLQSIQLMGLDECVHESKEAATNSLFSESNWERKKCLKTVRPLDVFRDNAQLGKSNTELQILRFLIFIGNAAHHSLVLTLKCTCVLNTAGTQNKRP